ncbi:hypothetical protein A3E39_01375 [Candidatus Uhrbacteria bacterium RIFCSPHIGHO2_12_FULL_60_25]|uniref:Glycosyltransferase subfamily 4-like N-terminal domain-containing protein n=1 Tax=Candidatus Uhrbacteria bacterium RIFCSPHIGHO2_12_FULL_60_25 TaxID=1802399 RepID=A0A1F7UKM4_9BACT|nr:MAG: hypothetical protein A3D73_03170 [Candidatus Uhrbacteria bacterium RIFCSPHIGHO2_02_FULL_60_44]OGL78795.1 MAG: hypothetical protein A3E39_01375 [Candidatus Uhrbacteria bacterium RIFCSPHIGHO2_12_FULL_60_25]
MGNSKRLLIVVTQAEWGGVQGYVARCAAEAKRRGFEVLVAAGGTGELESRCLNNGIPYRRLSRLRRDISPFADVSAIRELVALMREWRPDVVYLHSSKAGIIGSIAARIAKVPRVVYRIGGWSFLDPVSPLQKIIRRWSEKLTAGMKDVIITVHPGDEELARRVGIRPREALVTVANGIDLNAFDANLLSRDDARALLRGLWREGVPSHASMDEHDQLVLTVANFYPAKNLIGYLDAVKLINKERPRTRFLIIGDGESRTQLQTERAALGLDAIVSLPGKRDDAASLLQGADAFVLPSVKEGMSWAVLEAMAASLPCVVTDVGANRWMAEDACAVVPPRDHQALAHAILRLLDDKTAADRSGARARNVIERRFTDRAMWDATFNALLPPGTTAAV